MPEHASAATGPLCRRWCRAMVLLAGVVIFAAVPCQAAKAKKTRTGVDQRTGHLTAFQKDIPQFVAFKDELERFLGVPYRFGGVSQNGIDCSGFAKRLFAEAFGIELPHNSRAISRLDFLEDLPPNPGALRPSDLLFFGSQNGYINHVGISLGEDKFIHASRSKGVIVSSLRNSYWRRRLLASKRVTVLDDAQLTTLAAASPVEELSGEGAGQEFPAEVVALGYRQDVMDEHLSFGIEGVYGNRAFKDAVEVAGASTGAQWAGLTNESYQGWRALVDIRPSAWLCFTPWMGQMDVSDAFSGGEGDLGYYGLKTLIGDQASPWSLSLAAQSTHFHDFYTPSAGVLDEWRSLDLGLDFGYRFTPATSLSVSAWRSSLYEGGSEDPAADRLSDITLRLKIEF
ncbi:MAG: C40 family peptidase [Desulfobacterales bacterium]|nr:C40 family peptidase [Desulfobacteraceae bacterium]MDY0311728.1 C40 family peptidase [Desulfobacterales bacterium]